MVAELAKLAFSNILDYVALGEGGVPRFDFTALTRDQGAAIQTLTIDYWREPKADPAPRRVRVTLADKRAALADLTRHLHAEAALSDDDRAQIPRLVRVLTGLRHDDDPTGECGRLVWRDSPAHVPDELVRRVNAADGFGPVSNLRSRHERRLRHEQQLERAGDPETSLPVLPRSATEVDRRPGAETEGA